MRRAGTSDVIGAEEARTIPGLFLRRCERTPDAEAYRQREPETWRAYTWRDTKREVGRWQRALAREPLVRGDRVAVLARSGVEWVAFDLVAQSLGLVVVPLYTTDNPGNLAHILGDCGARLLFADTVARWRPLAPLAREFPSLERLVCLEESAPDERFAGVGFSVVRDWLPAEAADPEDRAGPPESLATIVYTSGTLGRPKGVMLSHANLLANAQAVLAAVAGYREDLYLSFLPLSHAFERTVGYYVPMMAGSTVAYARSVQRLPEDLAAIRPTVLVSVPRIYERAYARIAGDLAERRLARALFDATVALGWGRFEGRRNIAATLAWPLARRLVAKRILDRLGGRVRVAVSGGAPLAPELARVFIGLGLPLLQGYGLTEAAPVVAANRLEDNVPDSVGRALPGVELRLGADDELLVRGPSVMLGYWRQPEATRAAIDADGWLHTGDKARIEGGRVHIVGRLKEILVLSTAEKVPPADLELAITEDPHFEQAMVVGEGLPYLAALVVLSRERWPGLAHAAGVDPRDPGALSAPAVVGAALARIERQLARFPSYARVRRAWLTLEPWTIEAGLITPTLKLKRAELAQRFAGEIAQLYRQPA